MDNNSHANYPGLSLTGRAKSRKCSLFAHTHDSVWNKCDRKRGALKFHQVVSPGDTQQIHITHWHFQVHVIHILKTVWQVPISMECLGIKSDFNHLTALLKKWLQMLLFYVWLRTTRTIESLKNIWEHPFSWPIRDKPSEIKLIFTWILSFNRVPDSALTQGCIFLGEVHIKAHTFFCMYVPG